MRLRLLWGVLALAALPAAAAEPPSDAAVLAAFGTIAFGNEYVGEPDPRLQKWMEPVRWRSYEGSPLSEDEREFLERHIARLARLTGLGFSRADTFADANFLVLFVPETRYEATIARHLAPARRHLLPRLADTSCLGVVQSGRITHAIEFAVAIIPVERARARGLMRSCIAEETTQVLGLLNDADLPGTLFNDNADVRELTELDVMLVRMLYDQSLRPGMRRDEALAAARAALTRLRAAGLR